MFSFIRIKPLELEIEDITPEPESLIG